ncbi:bifunctional DNA-formamidopyrimidine glycosylase/DNA-(apurinic or apyrimidinic site) lyase [Sphingomonas sp. KRR8]|uniref:bifunctional DNA-formamidopyrimidine glycosylase/DNA-(apurinic or apyrimidinic site) lyase n=1 Tax=Sphingomonas sp. KRR8 TaxID=2942996 RepID=UPI00202171CD|nr:bifunctional DNA-formamidopyrimidine glycosylase/DNA-(apurinic or apyrimidinic site) lyase [Sphingomonas sp. KRR8]URD61432.1 bifunctional DNA-formamidopyrimidine glycosylase/DNA-(apurinic or apyrimidinic site) lyase [Sphingomonas sp. KRR8]
MPELPEVETTVRGLARVLQGRRLTRVEPRRPDLRRAFPEDLGQRLTGARVTSLRRRAKYGLIDTDRGDTLIFHLGMSGRWRIDPSEIDKHDHLLVETEEGRRLALNDPRRFGSVDLLPTAELASFAGFEEMGPEPFDLTAEELRDRLAGRTAAIKLLLLDQRIVAGLGNIYVCEALHRAGINPNRAGGKVSLDRLRRLVPAIDAVLDEAIAAGGSTLRDYAQPDGELGYFSKSFAVYDRAGEQCGCGGEVKRFAQGGRSTWYCPRCQR